MADRIARNLNLLSSITASDFSGGEAQKTLYTCSPPQSGSEIAFAECELIALRLNVDITSVSEATIVVVDITDSDTAALVKQKENELLFPRFLLSLYLNDGDSDHFIGSLNLFNRQPYYLVDLMPYFTGRIPYYLQSGYSIKAKVSDAGYGVFSDSDQISFVGSLKEYAIEPRGEQWIF